MLTLAPISVTFSLSSHGRAHAHQQQQQYYHYHGLSISIIRRTTKRSKGAQPGRDPAAQCLYLLGWAFFRFFFYSSYPFQAASTSHDPSNPCPPCCSLSVPQIRPINACLPCPASQGQHRRRPHQRWSHAMLERPAALVQGGAHIPGSDENL